MAFRAEIDLFGILDRINQNKQKNKIEQLLRELQPAEIQGPPAIQQTPTGVDPFGMGTMNFNAPSLRPVAQPTPQENEDRMNRVLAQLLPVSPQLASQALQFLQQSGKMVSPQEKVAAKRATLEAQKQGDLRKYRQESIRVRDEGNSLKSQEVALKKRHASIAEKKPDGVDEKALVGIRGDALVQYFKQRAAYERKLDNQWKLDVGLDDDGPTFEEWKAQRGVEEFPDQATFVDDWVKSVLPQGAKAPSGGGDKKRAATAKEKKQFLDAAAGKNPKEYLKSSPATRKYIEDNNIDENSLF